MKLLFKSVTIVFLCLGASFVLFSCSDMIADQEGVVVSGDTSLVTSLVASVESEEIILTWNEGAAADIDHIEITWSPDGSTVQTVVTGTENFAASNLRNGRAYTFTVRSIDSGGTVTSESVVTVTPVLAGAPANAVYIYEAAEVDDIRNNLSGYYVLMEDINLSGYVSWNNIEDFTGTLDGNSHCILNLTTLSGRGLFNEMYGTIMNLGLEGGSVNVSGGRTGALVGTNFGTITNCYSTVTVNVTGSSLDIGGLVGFNNGTVTNCFTSGAVTGEGRIGGLVGYNTVSGIITNCYSTSIVTGRYRRIGGLVGNNHGTLTNCYSAGSVSDDGSAGSTLGALVGAHYITDGVINDSYFVNLPDNGAGTYKTSGWDDASTFTNWDFTTVWAIDSTGIINGGYPYLIDNQP